MDECGNCKNLKKACDASAVNLKSIEPKSIIAGFSRKIRFCMSKISTAVKSCVLLRG